MRDDANLLAKAVLRNRRDILSIDENAAAFQIVKAQKQIYECRFAGARASDEADLFAGIDRQR